MLFPFVSNPEQIQKVLGTVFEKWAIETEDSPELLSLLDKDNLKLFKQYAADSISVIIYGQSQLEANGPWMILKQMGYQNIKVLLGGYHYFTTGPLDFYDMPEVPEYLVEERLFSN